MFAWTDLVGFNSIGFHTEEGGKNPEFSPYVFDDWLPFRFLLLLFLVKHTQGVGGERNNFTEYGSITADGIQISLWPSDVKGAHDLF